MLLGGSAAVGLDVGTSAVKVVQLRRSGAAIELERMAVAPVYPDGEKTGEASAARIDAIRRAMSAARITARQVVSAVSGESIIVRYLQLPEMPEDELRSALRFEAEEYIPYKIDDVYLDSDFLGRAADDVGAKVDVLLVSAKKDQINEHANLVRAAGLTPTIVDLDSFAFYNCFERNYQPEPDDVVALVNIGCSVTNINIHQNGTSRFSRDIAIAGDAITAAIQSRLGVKPKQAEEMKLREGLPEPDAQAPGGAGGEGSLLDTIRGTVERLTKQDLSQEQTPEALAMSCARSAIGNLILELRRSLQFYESQTNAKAVNKMLLGGGTARLRNIEAVFHEEFAMPVEIIDPFRRIGLTGKHLNAAELSDSKSALGVAVGLALRKVGE